MVENFLLEVFKPSHNFLVFGNIKLRYFYESCLKFIKFVPTNN